MAIAFQKLIVFKNGDRIGKYFSLMIKLGKMRMLNVMRQIIIYHGEDGYWVAQCPSLPPCISQGRTKQEAIAVDFKISLVQ
jgi:hypothetical protein